MTEETCPDAHEDFQDTYRRHNVIKLAFIFGSLVLLVAAIAYGMTIGDRRIEFFDVYGILWDHICGRTYDLADPRYWDDFVLWQERLPRVLGGVFIGMALSVAGAGMQAILRNPLADPYTTGISSGAMTGVTIALVLGINVAFFSESYSLIFFAFVCGLIPSAVIIGLSKFRGTSPATLILAGLAMSFMFSALCQLLLLGAEAETVQETYRWMNGTLNNIRIGQIPLLMAVSVVCCAFFFAVTKQLNLIGAGDNSAKSLGLDTDRFRNLCLVIVSVMVGVSVSMVGIVGFVGLVVPHICRYFVGNDNRFIVPASMVFGALLLVFSDIVSKMLTDTGMPVGVVLNFIGGPMFLLLIIRQRRDLW